jgi:hypothetical protein
LRNIFPTFGSNISDRFLLAAWILEILLVIVGAISPIWQMSLKFDAYIENATYIQATLPFLFVALIGLVKIPVVFFLYHQNIVFYKILLIVILLFFLATTFETFFLLLENQGLVKIFAIPSVLTIVSGVGAFVISILGSGLAFASFKLKDRGK